jgi:hypothetical protein
VRIALTTLGTRKIGSDSSRPLIAFVIVREERTVFMVSSRARGRTSVAFAAIAIGGLVGAGSIAVAQPADDPAGQPDSAAAEPDAAALALPGPNQFVSGLDLECFDTPGPPLNMQLQLTQLNPVLLQLGLAPHVVVVGALVQTCVPVQKNGIPPAAAALPFIRQTDLACYKVNASPLLNPIPLTLKHLNPVLGNLPAHVDKLVQPSQLCLPVAKNGVVPTPDILKLVQFIDLECYDTSADNHPPFTVNLKQLNPQLANIPPHNLTLVSQPRQLCVPVQKNNQVIPPDVLAIVRWIDLEKFPASPPVGVPAMNVVLSHLNPLLTTLPRVSVVLQKANALMVPVSKNGVVPPPP